MHSGNMLVSKFVPFYHELEITACWSAACMTQIETVPPYLALERRYVSDRGPETTVLSFE